MQVDFGYNWQSVSDGGTIYYQQQQINGGWTGVYLPCNCQAVDQGDVMSGYWDFSYWFGANDDNDWETYLDWLVYEPVYNLQDCVDCPACNVTTLMPQSVSQTWNLT